MAKTSSTQTNLTETSTQNIADSYNQTISKVLNLTDSGNVNITQPSQTGVYLLLPLILGGFIVFVLAIRKG